MELLEGNKQLYRAFGRAANEHGEFSEKRVQQVFTQALVLGMLPSWIKGYEVASELDQRKGYDAWINTDIGRIGLQIKSSIKQVEKAKRNRGKRAGDIAYVYTGYWDSDEKIINRCLCVVGDLYERYLQQRKEQV